MRLTSLLDHPFRDAYAAKFGALPGATQAWIDGLRQTARGILNTSGLPGPRVEAWKFTGLGDVVKIPFLPSSSAEDIDVREIPLGVPHIPGARRIVLVNGVLSAELSDAVNDPPGLRIGTLKHYLAREPQILKPILGGLASSGSYPMAALNTAYMSDGLVILADKNFPGSTLHIISIGAAGADPVAFHPRHIITLAAGAQLNVIETHIGLPGQSYLSNPLTEISVGENATLKRYVMVAEDNDAFHLSTAAVALAAHGTFEAFHLVVGGGKVRQEVAVAMNGAGATCRINGLYALTGKQHHDLTTVIDHAVGHGTSSQLVKGVVDGQSHGVFQGRIHVAKDAQKTDARQLHKALFLSKGPEVDCKPELEIFADDVQCAHGAATGEMDPNHLFYLMARGIDADTARAMLVSGFLEDAIATISDELVRAAFSDLVQSWLKRRAA
ncbi:MAG: Fe-S cluster assembly protein SufD [Alphaproteobacteria bacterium]|nr:Fe-S cluster assembly protein SufD [Alphaproteobacteria bacterium]PHY00743.1 MAG: Fe-S cluster assembly protein SufD [Rhodospirillaceae bacterium]